MAAKTRKPSKPAKKKAAKKKTIQKQPMRLTYWLLGLVLILPLIFTRATAEPVVTIRNLALAITCLTAFGFHFGYQRHRITLPKGRVIWFLGLWTASWLIGLISLVRATNLPEAAITVSQDFLMIAVMLLSVWILQREGRHRYLLVQALAVAGLFHAVVGILQYVGIVVIEENITPPYSFSFNRNLFGAYLSMLVPFSIAQLVQGDFKWKLIGGLGLVAEVTVLIMTQTRAAWLAVGAVLALAYLFAFLLRDRFSAQQLRLWWRINIGALIAFVAIFLIALQLGLGGKLLDSTVNRVSTIFDRSNNITMAASTATERLQLWENSLYMMRDNPLLGVAPNHWKLAAPPYIKSIPSIAHADYFLLRPHNTWLQLGVERGIPALLLYMGAWALLFLMAFQIVKRAKSFQEIVFRLSVFGGILAYVVNMMFNFPHERIEPSVLLAILTGIVLTTYAPLKGQPKEDAPPATFSLPLWSNLLIILLLVGAVAQSYMSFKFQTIWTKSYIGVVTNNHDEAIKWCEEGLNCWHNLGPNMDPLSLVGSFGYQRKGNLDRAEELLFQSRSEIPNSYRVYSSLGSVYSDMKDYERSSQSLLRCLELTPESRETKENLAVVYFLSEQYDKCLEVTSSMELLGDEQLIYMHQESQRKLAQ